MLEIRKSGKAEMYGKLLLRISAVTAYFIVDAKAVQLAEHSANWREN